MFLLRIYINLWCLRIIRTTTNIIIDSIKSRGSFIQFRKLGSVIADYHQISLITQFSMSLSEAMRGVRLLPHPLISLASRISQTSIVLSPFHCLERADSISPNSANDHQNRLSVANNWISSQKQRGWIVLFRVLSFEREYSSWLEHG